MTGVSTGIEPRGMEPRGSESSIRVLGLGNDILGDDALGILVARQAEARFGGQVEVISSSQAGFHVMDQLLGVSRLVVVDCIQTGAAKPGTVYVPRTLLRARIRRQSGRGGSRLPRSTQLIRRNGGTSASGCG